jgi:NAD(P)-dependent dehydrogenase (short-subunit alcohol dehydrogenase family)
MEPRDESPVPDYPALLRLDGRRFLVLGSGNGTGRQVAHALHANGARVAGVDIDAGRAEAVAAEIDGVALTGDLTDGATAERLIGEADAALGGLDGIVDIIGMARYASIVDTTDEEWDWHHDIVLRHAFHAVRFGAPVLARADGARPGGGVMVFIASVSGLTSAPSHAAYGAAKAGLMSLVRTSAVELGPAGVRVNAVAPGVVWTPRIAAALGDERRARNEENTPLGRVALPADIAAAVLFLCSDLASYVTGQTLVVDGGVGAKFPYPMAD